MLIVSSGSLIKQTPLLIFLNLPLVFPFYLIWVTIQGAISQQTRTSILDKLGYLKKEIFLSVCADTAPIMAVAKQLINVSDFVSTTPF